jgi:hypothetical protein
LLLSTITGTRAISGSAAIRLRKRTMAATLSSMASSMLTSMTCAPFSTCWRATPAAFVVAVQDQLAEGRLPVTLVRSPMLTNRRIGGRCRWSHGLQAGQAHRARLDGRLHHGAAAAAFCSKEPSALAQLHARLDARPRRHAAGVALDRSRWPACHSGAAHRAAAAAWIRPGSAAVRPALAVVLDRVAERRPQASRPGRCAAVAPSDARKPPAQGIDRAGAVRDYLVLKGLAAARFTAPQAAPSTSTELTVSARELPNPR